MLPLSKSLFKGVDFPISPMVMKTSGIDVILGLDWMKQYDIDIKCKERVVALTTPKGERISVDITVQTPLTAKVNQLNDDVDPQNRVVDEFLDIFPDNSDAPECHGQEVFTRNSRIRRA